MFSPIKKWQVKPSRQNALNRNKNTTSNEASAHFSNNTNPTSSNTATLQWKKQQDNSTKSNSEIGIKMSPSIPSTSRHGEYRASDQYNCDTSAARSSYDAKNSPLNLSMMKYRSSISDLGDSNLALDRLTNTRLKSIKNRRGAVKYQKYVFIKFRQLFSFLII